jgi:hypothetical protein
VRLDPAVAQKLVEAAWSSIDEPSPASRTRLEQAIRTAEENDRANRERVYKVYASLDGRPPVAGDFTNMTRVMPTEPGGYGA